MKKVVLALLLIFISNLTFSQNTFEFLRIDMSARAAALGGSFSTNTDDPDVMFYNPAGINQVKDKHISFSFTKYFEDINLFSLAFVKEFAGLGKFSAGIKYVNYGQFTGADEFGNKTGDFSVNEAALIAGYSNTLDDNFYYGANIKFVYSKIADRAATGIAFDLGLNYTLPDNKMSFGFSVLNAGSQLSSYYDKKEDLPLDITLGVSKELAHLPLKLSLDFHRLNTERDDFLQKFKAFSLGAEFTLSKVFNLRLGYDNERRKDLKIGDFSGLAGFNLGVGINISSYQFNYGFSSFGLMDGVHRISLNTVL